MKKAAILCGLCEQKNELSPQDWGSRWVLWQCSRLTDGVIVIALWGIVYNTWISVFTHADASPRSSSALNFAHNVPIGGFDPRAAGMQSCLCAFFSLIAVFCHKTQASVTTMKSIIYWPHYCHCYLRDDDSNQKETTSTWHKSTNLCLQSQDPFRQSQYTPLLTVDDYAHIITFYCFVERLPHMHSVTLSSLWTHTGEGFLRNSTWFWLTVAPWLLGNKVGFLWNSYKSNPPEKRKKNLTAHFLACLHTRADGWKL